MDSPQKTASKHGGARPGAGMPKGKVTKKKLEQQEALNMLQQRIMRHVDELFEAQLNLALGKLVYLVKVKDYADDGNVKRIHHQIVEGPEIIKQYLDGELDGEITCITIKSPDNRAIESLFDRAFGKAPSKVETEGGFFGQPELTVRVLGASQGDTSIGDDGQVQVRT